MTVGLGVDVQPDRRGMVISQRLLSDDAVRDVQEVAVALQWAEMTLAVFGGAPDEGEVPEEWPGKDLQALCLPAWSIHIVICARREGERAQLLRLPR